MDDLSQRVRAFLDAYTGDAPVPESVVEIVGDLENDRRRLTDSERYAWKNTCEIDAERMRFRTALEQIRDGKIIQGMSPALFAEKVLSSPDSAGDEHG